ncbi:anaerobic ribonucleoside-triphosphate reductase activating protein [Prevotella sp. CAG:1124]|nr:anaerobic ribonucleoside-triphosphate reductase activating protein [Prevotella sp. CAG:1124]
MLKYVDSDIVFQEIPDEVTLAVNISNCPFRCSGCHSMHLWKDIGEPLTVDVIDGFINKYGGAITCVCFMGGDAEPDGVAALSRYVHERYPGIKVGWYSGRNAVTNKDEYGSFDYIKLGPYIESLGGLDNRSTNQRLYRRGTDGRLIDMTSRFWKLP